MNSSNQNVDSDPDSANLSGALCERLGTDAARCDDPAFVAQALSDSGLLHLLVPRHFGGLQQGWQDLVQITGEVARTSGSAAWLLAEYGINAALLARMNSQVQEEVWVAPANQAIALAWYPVKVECRSAEGGNQVSGTWKHVAGAAHADWVLALTDPVDLQDMDGQSGPTALLIPREALDTDELDHLGGLRGAGIQNIAANNLFVPDTRTVDFANLLGIATTASGPDSAAGIPFLEPWLCAQLGSMLGCAWGGYEEYRAITSRWVAGIGGTKVASLTQVQSRLAHTKTELKLASLLTDDLLSHLRADTGSQPATKWDLAADRSQIAQLCLQAVTRLVQQMGARGLFENNPLQRRFRDLRVMVGHPAFAWQEHMAALGRQELGLPDEDQHGSMG